MQDPPKAQRDQRPQGAQAQRANQRRRAVLALLDAGVQREPPAPATG